MSAVTAIKKQIERLELKLRTIQSDCSHPTGALTKKHGANTGNYDPSNNCYWTDFHCSLCNKRWTAEGSL